MWCTTNTLLYGYVSMIGYRFPPWGVPLGTEGFRSVCYTVGFSLGEMCSAIIMPLIIQGCASKGEGGSQFAPLGSSNGYVELSVCLLHGW